MAQWLGSFVPNLAQKANNLFELLGKDKPWEWNKKHQEAFDQIKNALTKKAYRTYVKNGYEIELYMDASTTGLGAALVVKRSGQRMLVACIARSLNSSEKKYPAHQLEGLAVNWAMYKFSP